MFKNLFKKGKEKYNEYQAKEPERRAARLEKLKYQTQEVKAKNAFLKEKEKMMKAQKAAGPEMPSLGFGSMSMGEPMRKKKGKKDEYKLF